MSRYVRGWFADGSDDAPKGYPFQPCLQLDGMCMSSTVWFQTREECEQWIRENVIGQRMYDDQVRAYDPAAKDNRP